jgi:hypothetical protein
MNMQINKELVTSFEKQLNPLNLAESAIKARLIGFGEISSIFELEDSPGLVFKRMPLFRKRGQAEGYLQNYKKYVDLLKKAGITLPDDDAVIVEKSPDLTVVYFAQQKLNHNSIANKLIGTMTSEEIRHLAKRILTAIYGVWDFNKNHPETHLAIDAQLSNWSFTKESDTLIYIDTTTPLFKIYGNEQLDPELLLTSAPSFGRAIIRKFFLADVMNRYYDEKSVNVDIVANLYKEQHPELIPVFLEVVNEFSTTAITQKEITYYYREDKFIWQLFLSLRKIDRWLHKYVYRKQYQFILPGKVAR